MTDYLNNTDTKILFGFDPAYNYSSFSEEVYEALDGDFMMSDCIERLEYVLTKLPVLVYNGQNDMIVPNPANDRFRLTDTMSKVTIYSITGQLIKQFGNTNSQTEFDITDLTTGVYFVKTLNSLGREFTLKLVKQ